MAKDPISVATESLLVPRLRAHGFERLTNRITARIVDDILQFVSVQVSRRGSRWFRLEYASIGLFRPRDTLPLQPGGTITRMPESQTLVERLFRTGSRQAGFDGTSMEAATASMSEAAGLVETQAIPFFAQTRTPALLYNKLLHERWGSDHHLHFEVGCCRTRMGQFEEASTALRRALRLYREDGRDWCGQEVERVTALLAALEQGRSHDVLERWTRESMTNLCLNAFAGVPTDAAAQR